MEPHILEALPSEFDQQCKELYSLVCSSFENDFDPTQYHARLTVGISGAAAQFERSPDFQRVYELTRKQIERREPWVIDVDYLHDEQTIGVSRMEIPLRSPDSNLSFVLQRAGDRTNPSTGAFYVPLLRYMDSETQITGPQLGIESPTTTFSSDEVDKLLSAAGYVFPKLFTDRDAIRECLIDLQNSAITWTATESREYRRGNDEHEDDSLLLTRKSTSIDCGQTQDLYSEVDAVFRLPCGDGRTREMFRVQFLGGLIISDPVAEFIVQEYREPEVNFDPSSDEQTLENRQYDINLRVLQKLSERLVDILCENQRSTAERL